MLFIWNLGLPWLLICGLALFQPASLLSHHWILEGLRDNLTLYGFNVYSKQHGFTGLFFPLAIFHNIVFLSVRFIQARMDLDFLPMIRHVLLWIGFVLFGYLSWISFNHGAKFGEFHTWSLLILPLFSFCLGLGFFVYKDKEWGAAQITALLVAWSPMIAIVSTLAGNHLRPHSLFNEVAFEPGGEVLGWRINDEKTRSSEFLRLRLIKEGNEFEFPALGRNLKVRLDKKNRVMETSADLDPLRQDEILALPETLDEQGWRPMADNENQLKTFCGIESPKSPFTLQWSKSNAVLNLVLRRCLGTALWSFQVSTNDFPLGELEVAKVSRVQEQRQLAPTALQDVDQSLIRAKDWRQRKLGVDLLSLVNSEDVLPSLINAFYDSDLEVRQAAAIGLMSWGSKAEPFLDKALNDPNPYMRGDALRLLAHSRRHEPHPAVYRLLGDSSPYVKISAVRALLPFAKDNKVIKTIMSALNKEFDEHKEPNTFLNDEFHSELVMTLAESRDVRVANLLIKVLPLELHANEPSSTRAEDKAAEVLREMKTWMGTDYLQSIVKKSSVQANRQKALSIMAHLRKPGDDEVFIKALKDKDLATHAMGLVKFFDSDAVRLALEEAQKPESNEGIKIQAR